MSASRAQSSRNADRIRAAEGLGPRPSELLADRLGAAAALARMTSTLPIEGAPDARALAELSAVQRRDEDALIACWHNFREHYVRYLDIMRAREATLKRALDVLSAATGDRAAPPKVRAALRMCRLRRPPLAKVEALVAEARALDETQIMTQTS